MCAKGVAPRWLGYIAVWSETRKSKYMLELTHSAAESIAAKAEEAGSLRGWMIRVKRDRANSELKAGVAPSGLDAETIPASFDLREQLRRMWGLLEDEKKTIKIVAEDDPRLAEGQVNRLNGHHANGKRGA
jgi:hypothetical protein